MFAPARPANGFFWPPEQTATAPGFWKEATRLRPHRAALSGGIETGSFVTVDMPFGPMRTDSLDRDGRGHRGRLARRGFWAEARFATAMHHGAGSPYTSNDHSEYPHSV